MMNHENMDLLICLCMDGWIRSKNENTWRDDYYGELIMMDNE